MAVLRARLGMVARLLREERVEDLPLLWALLRVPRHRFVPPELEALAYSPDALELSPAHGGQTVTCPDFVSMMITAVGVRPGARVLEVGTGTGYQAALLAAMGAQVTSVEVRPEAHALARRFHTRAHGRRPWRADRRVELRLADGFAGAPDRAPFDAIIVGCAVEPIPEALLDQLAVGGRLVAPEGDPDRIQTLVRVERTAGGFEKTELRAAWFVPMVRADAA